MMDRICALGEVFRIISVERNAEDFALLHCIADSDNRRYTILHFSNDTYVRRLLPSFYEWMEREESGDYRGCFAMQGGLYAVFFERDGRPLMSLLEEGVLSLEQRILTGKKILEWTLIDQIPEFFLCQMLLPQRICLQGENPVFSYGWDCRTEIGCGMAGVCRAAGCLMRALFAEEAARNASPSLTEMTEWLEQGEARNLLAIYQAYQRMADSISEEVSGWRSPRQERREKMSHFRDRSLRFALILLPLLLLLATGLALAGQFRKQAEAQKETQGVIFESIGTLPIR